MYIVIQNETVIYRDEFDNVVLYYHTDVVKPQFSTKKRKTTRIKSNIFLSVYREQNSKTRDWNLEEKTWWPHRVGADGYAAEDQWRNQNFKKRGRGGEEKPKNVKTFFSDVIIALVCTYDDY